MSSKTRNYLRMLSLAVILAMLFQSNWLVPLHAIQAVTTLSPTSSAKSEPKNFSFNYLHMFSVSNGWALAENPTQYKEYVLHTYDGGKSWKNVSPPDFTTSYSSDTGTFFFLDDSHAWLAAHTTLWRSNDGGQSWITTPAKEDILGDTILDFADSSNGWMLWFEACSECDPPSLYHTSDGGASWAKISGYDGVGLRNALGHFPLAAYTQMVFASKSVGWMTLAHLTSYDRDSHTFPNLHYTTNAGRIWHEAKLPPPSDNATLEGCHFDHIFAFNADTLALIAKCDLFSYKDNHRVFIYHTGNNGQSWEIASPNYLEDWLQIQMISPKIGFVMTGSLDDPKTNTLSQTSDGGLTWATLPLLPNTLTTGQYNHGLFFDFFNQNTGWCIGVTGNLAFTSDAGKSWIPLNIQIIAK